MVSVATDLAGNSVTLNSATRYTIDTTAPVLPVLTLAKSLINSSTYTDTISVEAGATVRTYIDSVLVDTRTVSGSSFSESISLPEGTHRLTFDSKDVAGNISATLSHSITVDLTAPSLTLDSAASVTTLKAGTYQGSLIFSELLDSSGTASVSLVSDLGSVPVSITSISGSTMTVAYPIASSATNGRYAIHVMATDLAGNLATLTSSKNYMIDTTAPVQPVWQNSVSIEFHSI